VNGADEVYVERKGRIQKVASGEVSPGCVSLWGMFLAALEVVARPRCVIALPAASRRAPPVESGWLRLPPVTPQPQARAGSRLTP